MLMLMLLLLLLLLLMLVLMLMLVLWWRHSSCTTVTDWPSDLGYPRVWVVSKAQGCQFQARVVVECYDVLNLRSQEP